MPELIAKPPLDVAPLTLADTTLTLADPGPITCVALFPGGAKAAAKGLKTLGLTFPEPGTWAAGKGGARIVWTGRDQAFVLGAAAPAIDGAAVLVVDPMLATGGSAVHAIEVLRRHGARPLGYAGIIGCAQGVSALHDADPELRITLAALDPGLDENAYILPGLGDAGDRTFAT